MVEENSGRESRDYRDVIVFEKLIFKSVFRPAHQNTKPTLSNLSGLKSVSVKHCLGDGLLWTAGLTVEIKLQGLLNVVS